MDAETRAEGKRLLEKMTCVIPKGTVAARYDSFEERYVISIPSPDSAGGYFPVVGCCYQGDNGKEVAEALAFMLNHAAELLDAAGGQAGIDLEAFANEFHDWLLGNDPEAPHVMPLTDRNSIVQFATSLAARLTPDAAGREDDGEAISCDFLIECGAEDCDEGILRLDGPRGLELFVWLDSDGNAKTGNFGDSERWFPLTTKGQFRQLCTALGVTLKEGM